MTGGESASSPASPPLPVPRVIGRGSLVGWMIFLMVEATLTQGLLSLTIVPLMVLVNLPRVAFIALVGRRDEARRLGILTAVSVMGCGLALVMTAWQNGVARERADRIVRACEEYQAAEGALPPSLEALVPRFLPALLPLKPIAGTEPRYSSVEGFPYLMYIELPPFGKRTYDFQHRRWVRGTDR